MINPEEIELKIKELVQSLNCMGTYGLIELELRDYYKAVYNQAIEDAAKNVQCDLYTRGLYKGAKWLKLKDGDSYNPLENSIMGKVDKQSIRKLKKK